MSLIQDMFLVSQNPDDHQLQQYAAWAVSFLRHYLWFKEVRNEESNFRSDTVGSKSVSHSFPGDSLVMKLSTWLMHHNYPGVGLFPQPSIQTWKHLYFCKVLSLAYSESIFILSQAVIILWKMFILVFKQMLVLCLCMSYNVGLYNKF